MSSGLAVVVKLGSRWGSEWRVFQRGAPLSFFACARENGHVERLLWMLWGLSGSLNRLEMWELPIVKGARAHC